MTVGTYHVHIKCLNCSNTEPPSGVVSKPLEYPSMVSVGENKPVDVYPPGLKRIRGVVREARLEYEFTCYHCGRKVWLQVREEKEDGDPGQIKTRVVK